MFASRWAQKIGSPCSDLNLRNLRLLEPIFYTLFCLFVLTKNNRKNKKGGKTNMKPYVQGWVFLGVIPLLIPEIRQADAAPNPCEQIRPRALRPNFTRIPTCALSCRFVPKTRFSRGTFPILSRDPPFQNTSKIPGKTDPAFGQKNAENEKENGTGIHP